MTDKPLISLLVPVFNEEENIRPLYREVSRVMAELADRYDWELVFTDNCSTDNTLALGVELAESDDRVRIYSFSRNFGFQRSVLTAYKLARGAAAVQLDCDLQDPPSLILDFVEHWEEGYEVVYGVRASRKEGVLITTMRRVFYRLIDALSEHELPHHAGDFRLVDRVVIDELLKVRDVRPYIRGTLATLGFDQIGIPYAREARERGESKFSFSDLVSLALDGILSQSVLPLKVATYVGLGGFVVAFVVGVGYLVGSLFLGQEWPPGFATLVLLILTGIGLNGLFMGIVGEYVSRIFKMMRNEPDTIVAYHYDQHTSEAAPTTPRSLSSSEREKTDSG